MKTLVAIIAVLTFAPFGLAGCGGGGGGAAASPTPAPSTTPTPTPTPTPTSGPEVGKFTLTNDGSQIAARAFSFGQVFSAGAVKPNDALQLTLGGSQIPVQMDAKALNADGSVRHAVLSAELPALSGGQRLQGAILVASGGANTTIPAYVATPNLDVVLTLSGRQITLNLPTLTQNSANAVGNPWLRGPVAQERRYRTQVDDHLEVAFDVFTPRTGPARVDVIFRNDWIGISPKDERVYDVDMRMNGTSVYQARAVRHYALSSWHRTLWTDGSPQIRIAPDLAGLEQASVVPRYEANFPIHSSFASEIANAANSISTAPLSSGSVTMAMPTTGGRLDIGPLPTWAVVDLLNGNATSRKLLMANADAAGAIPWHLRERATSLPPTTDAHPDVWLDPRGGVNLLTEFFEPGNQGWEIDDAHQPSLTYLPYVITGSQYYRDELAQQAAYVLLSYDAGYRGGAEALIIGANGEAWQQVRGLAWSLRTIAQAAFIMPSQDPMRPYFDTKLKGNLAKINQVFAVDRAYRDAGEVEGWIPGSFQADGLTAPWQQGFLATVLSWTNDMGYADAGRIATWMSPFISGLFTNSAKGFDPERGVSFSLAVSDAQTGAKFNTWAQVSSKSGLAAKRAQDVSDEFTFYAMILRSGNAGAYSASGSANAATAYNFLTARLNRIADPIFRGDPTFAIAPSRALP